MRIILFHLFATLLASAEQSPSKFMTAWVSAYDKNDAETMVSFYDRSDDTECLVSVGLWLKGYGEIKDMYVQDMKAIHFYDSKAEGMKHRMLGDVAVVSFIHKFKYLVQDTGEHYRIHIRTTATLKKDKDDWKIVSEHSSPIKGIERALMIKKENVDAPTP